MVGPLRLRVIDRSEKGSLINRDEFGVIKRQWSKIVWWWDGFGSIVDQESADLNLVSTKDQRTTWAVILTSVLKPSGIV